MLKRRAKVVNYFEEALDNCQFENLFINKKHVNLYKKQA